MSSTDLKLDGDTRRTVWIALIANVVIAAAKIAVGLITASPALLSEAAHSSADTLNEVLLLVSVARSRRRPDRVHPFGYGKARYFYAMLAAVGIFVTGACFSFYQGVSTLFGGRGETELFGLGYAVLAMSLAVEGGSLIRAVYQASRAVPRGPRRLHRFLHTERDPTLATVLAEDSAAVVGVLIAAAGLSGHQLTGDTRWEGAASIGIAALLTFAAFRLGRSAEALLIGQAAPNSLVRDAYLTLADRPEVDTVLEFLTMRLGPDEILLAARIDLADGMDSDEVEAACGRVKEALQQRFPAFEQIFLDITDATPRDRAVARKRRRLLESGDQYHDAIRI